MKYLDKLDYKILHLLKNGKFIAALSGTTISFICNNLSGSPETAMSSKSVSRRVRNLLESELVSEGFKCGKRNTYYINENGLKKLREVVNGNER